MRISITLFFLLQIMAQNAFGQAGGGTALTERDFYGVSTAENITVDSTGLFVRFGNASARLLFSQEVELTVNGVVCTFGATIFVLSMHPVTVLAIGELSDYISVFPEEGRMTVEVDGVYMDFNN